MFHNKWVCEVRPRQHVPIGLCHPEEETPLNVIISFPDKLGVDEEGERKHELSAWHGRHAEPQMCVKSRLL